MLAISDLQVEPFQDMLVGGRTFDVAIIGFFEVLLIEADGPHSEVVGSDEIYL